MAKTSGAKNTDNSKTEITPAIQKASDALPDLTGHPSLDNIRAAFTPLSTEDRVRAVTLKLLQGDAAAILREREKQVRQLGVALDLHQNLNEAARSILDRSSDLKNILTFTFAISTIPLMQQRMLGVNGSNMIVRHFDELAMKISRQCGMLFAAEEAAKKYLQEAKIAHDSLVECQTLEDKCVKLDLLEEHISAFSGILYKLEEQFIKLPGFCSEISEGIKRTVRDVNAIYGPEELDKKDNSPKNFFDLIFGNSSPSNLNLPIYKDNVYLTAYLHGLVEQMPVLDPQADVPKRLNRDPEVSRFVAHLKIHADNSVYSHITSTSLYKAAAECLEKLHISSKGIYLAIKATDIWNVLRDGRRSVTAGYNRISEEVNDQITGRAAALIAYEQFDPGLMLDAIKKISPTGSDSDREKGGPKPRHSKKDESLLKLFEEMEIIVQKLITKTAGNQEIEEFLKKALDFKREVGGKAGSAKINQLKTDIDTRNFAFKIEPTDMGALELARVPTSPFNMADIFGASWLDVSAGFETLLKYAEFPFLLTKMTIRGKVNNNACLAGPPGCGKNLFVRAVNADSRVIAITVFSELVKSMWHSRSEANTRLIWELADEKVKEIGKPALINWDEFDAIFPNGRSLMGAGDIATSMQKTLQSVLEGDVVYDGISLVTMTNNPERIPAATLRRFSHLWVIQALTKDERYEAIQHFLSGLPLSPGFDVGVNWESFAERTASCHGDAIGKIFDEVYKAYLGQIEDRAGVHIWRKIEAAAKSKSEDGTHFSQALRSTIFTEFATDTSSAIVVTPQLFEGCVDRALATRDMKVLMQSHDSFYHEIDKKLDEAFGSDKDDDGDFHV